MQTHFEEKLNALTHGIGAVLGVVALVLLIVFDSYKTPYSLLSVIVYGISIIILFTASTLYHAVKSERNKHYFRIVDHISIYLLIAGTYTPVLLISLNESLGWTLFYTCFLQVGLKCFQPYCIWSWVGSLFSILKTFPMFWAMACCYCLLAECPILWGLFFMPFTVFHIIMLYGTFLY